MECISSLSFYYIKYLAHLANEVTLTRCYVTTFVAHKYFCCFKLTLSWFIFLLDLWCTKRKYFDCFYLKLFKSEAAFCSCSIRCSADVFLWILRYYYKRLFHRTPSDSQLLITGRLISLCYMQSLETHYVDSTLKRRGNDQRGIHVVCL